MMERIVFAIVCMGANPDIVRWASSNGAYCVHNHNHLYLQVLDEVLVSEADQAHVGGGVVLAARQVLHGVW